MAAAAGRKVVLVTGCSSGIGLAIAVILARDEKKRYHVIATMRDLQRKDRLLAAAGDAYEDTLFLRTLDVCSDESVRDCVNSVQDRHIDILTNPTVFVSHPAQATVFYDGDHSAPPELKIVGKEARCGRTEMPKLTLRTSAERVTAAVNNAGVGLVGPVEGLSMEEMAKVFETNFFGAVRMIKEVVPDMKRRRSGHIVVISSVMGLQGELQALEADGVLAPPAGEPRAQLNPVPPDEHLSLSLSLRWSLSMVEPGPVHTEFELKMISDTTKKHYPNTDPETLEHFRTCYLPTSINIFQGLGQTLKFADESGDLSLHTFYHMLYNLGGVMDVSLRALRFLSCSCWRRRAVTPT
ncbi:hypothetical protein DNTS_030242 [Danionella cerebrum]|uniref:Uncharacterized protein n=1 Tax=Danionella cerebrum TaxID=2873325 RepID=A0A553Q8E9_9TELE|nr:hypothetical protein DNTS_030242 [Danionella translucida]